MSLATSITGCAKRSAESSASPAMDMAPGDELAMLEQQLTQREAQLQAAGYRPAPRERLSRDGAESKPVAPITAVDEPSPMAGATSTAPAPPTSKQAEDANEGGRCRQVCEITTAICELEGQICGLVPRHPEDPRYQAACSRAADDCRFATEACNACT